MDNKEKEINKQARVKSLGLYVLFKGIIWHGVVYSTLINIGLTVVLLNRVNFSELLRYWALSIGGCIVVGTLLAVVDWYKNVISQSIQETTSDNLPAKLSLNLKWTKDDVISAQRMHYLQNTRLKLVVGLCLIAAIALSIELIWLQLAFDKQEPLLWFIPLLIIVLMVAAPTFIYVVFLPARFQRDPWWRFEYDLRLYEDRLSITPNLETKNISSKQWKLFGFTLTVSDEPGDRKLKWNRFRRVLENERVYTLCIDSGEDFVIIPKQVFQTREQEELFRNILRQKASPVWKSKT